MTWRYLRLLFAAPVALQITAAAALAQQPPPKDATASMEIRRANGERDVDKFRRLNPYFRSWLNEDAVYVISPQERQTFLALESDEERSKFISQFWSRRNPSPESVENAFEQEHYRRIVYANGHFGGTWEGWKTDRGRLYIAAGPPDQVESSTAGTGCLDPDTANQVNRDAPFRITWKYRNFHGSGEDFEVWFFRNNAESATPDNSGFEISFDRCRFVPRGISYAPEGIFAALLREEMIWKYSASRDEERQPQNLELEALLSSHDQRSHLPLRVRFGASRATTITSLASVRVSIPSATGGVRGKSDRGTSVAVYGRFVKNASRKVESQFESSVFPIRSGTRSRSWVEICDTELPLPAGAYELQIAVKDNSTGEVSTHYSVVSVDPSTPKPESRQ